MKRRFLAAIAAAAFVVLVMCGIVLHGQAFYPPNTPKFPQARTWLVQKANCHHSKAPRTTDGVPSIQGNWAGRWAVATTISKSTITSTSRRLPRKAMSPIRRMGRSRTRRGRSPNGTRSTPGWGEGGRARQAGGYTAIPRRCAWSACPLVLRRAGDHRRPGSVIMLTAATYRVIPTDGRPHMDPGAKFSSGTPVAGGRAKRSSWT